jgi:hypothetical protein
VKDKTGERQWIKVYLFEVPALRLFYVGQTRRSVAQRLREHYRGTVMGLPLLKRTMLNTHIQVHLLDFRMEAADANEAEARYLRAELARREGWTELNLLEPPHTKRQKAAADSDAKHWRDAPPPTIGAVRDIFVRGREQKRLSVLLRIDQAMAGRNRVLVRELVAATGVNATAIRSAVKGSGTHRHHARYIELQPYQEEDMLITDDELVKRLGQRAVETEAATVTEEDRRYYLRADDPSRLRTDIPGMHPAKVLYAKIHNGTASLQQMHDGDDAERSRIFGTSKLFTGNSDDARHKLAAWQKELGEIMAALKDKGDAETLRSINAYINSAPLVAAQAVADGWAQKQDGDIIAQLSAAKGATTSGALVVTVSSPKHEPDF